MNPTYPISKDHQRIMDINMAENHWIQKANLKKGSFTKFAKSKGESVSEAIHDKNLSPLRQKQARLAETFRKMAHKI
jgi:hypothetical protein